jgi:hypothetical protein
MSHHVVIRLLLLLLLLDNCCCCCCCWPAEPGKVNAMLPIGGPGKAVSAKEQADILFR